MKKLAIVLLGAIVVLTSCNKDRIDEEVSFQPMDEFFDNNKPQEQEFVITSDSGSAPIIGMDGTELYGFRNILQYPSGDTVPLPYSIKLIELYTYEDMVLYQIPTLSGASILESAGEIKIRACHEGNELELKPGAKYPFQLSTTPPKVGMEVYHGNHPGDKYGDWVLSTDGSGVRTGDKYDVTTAKLGWQNIGQVGEGSSSTNITFKVEGTGGEYIELFFALTDYHGLLQGHNLVIPNAPVGQVGTIIAMAKNQDAEYMLYKQEVTVTDGMEITLDFNKVSETELLSTLANL